MLEGQSEDEEREEGLPAGQAQGSSSLSAENISQSLRQEGKDFGKDVRGGRLGREGDQVRVSSLCLGLSAPLLWLQSSLIRAANDREEDGKHWTLGGLGLL